MAKKTVDANWVAEAYRDYEERKPRKKEEWSADDVKSAWSGAVGSDYYNKQIEMPQKNDFYQKAIEGITAVRNTLGPVSKPQNTLLSAKDRLSMAVTGKPTEATNKELDSKLAPALEKKRADYLAEMATKDYSEKPVSLMSEEEKQALKAEYESIPNYNVFQSRNIDINNKVERKQKLYNNYRELKNEDAYNALINHGFTDEEIRYLNGDPISDEELRELEKQGLSEEEIIDISNQRADAQMRALSKFEDVVNSIDDSWGVTSEDVTNMVHDRYAIPEIRKDAEKHPVSNSLFTIAANPFESALSTGANLYNYVTGRPLRNYQTGTDVIRDTVSQNIDSQFGRTVYGGAMSLGDMAAAVGTAYATGGGSIVSAGIQALEKASQVMGEGADRGLSADQIFAEGIASGLTTYVTEKIPMGKLEDVAEKGLTDYSAREIGKYLGSMFISEGLQEGAEDIADWAMDAVVAWDKNEFNTDVQNYIAQGLSPKDAVAKVVSERAAEMMTDVVIGGISGAAVGGSAVGTGYITGKVNAPSVNTDAVMESPEALNRLIEAAQTLKSDSDPENADRIEYAKELANKPVEELQKEDVVDIANVLNEQADASNNYAQAIQEINYRAGVESNLNQYQQTGTITPGEYETQIETAARQQAESIVKEHENSLRQQERQAQRNLNKELRNFENNIQNYEKAEVAPVQQEALTKAAEGFENETAAKTYMNNYSGQNLELYTKASYLAYRAGESGQSFDTFMKNSNIASAMVEEGEISEAYLKNLYYNGQNARTVEEENPAFIENENLGKATGITSDDKLAEFKTRLAKKLGIEVNTNHTDTTSRGNFSAALARITVNATADNEYAALVHEMFEFARAYNAKGMENAEKALVNMVVNKSSEAKFVKAVEEYRDAYRRAGQNAPEGSVLRSEANKTFSEAQEEFINDAISYIFSSDEGMQNLVDYIMNDNETSAEEKVSAIQAIKDWVDHLIQTIKDFISGNKSKQLAYDYTEKLGLTSEELESISRMLTGVLDTARENLAKQTKAESKESGEETVAHSVDVFAKEGKIFIPEEYTEDYLKSGDRKNKNRLKSYNEGKRITVKNHEELIEFLNGSDDFADTVAVGVVSNLIAEDIYEKSNGVIDAEGYFWELENGHTMHLENKHSQATEDGDLPLSINELAYVIEHINDAKVIDATQYSNGEKIVRLAFEMEDGFVVLVEVASKSTHGLKMKTGWKNTAQKFEKKFGKIYQAPRNNEALDISNRMNTAESKSSSTVRDKSVLTYNVADSEGKSNKNDAEKKNFSLNVPVEEKAKEHFGTTEDFQIAGYLLTDGTMLDFSGAHWMEGASAKEIADWRRNNHFRQVDHEDIYEVMEASGDNRKQFMDRGNIRLSPEAPGFNISSQKEPTAAQYRMLKEFIREVKNNPEYDADRFYVDIETNKPNKIIYENNLNEDRIINDIKSYFETGEMPKQSTLNQFRYSLDVKYNDAYTNNDTETMDKLVKQTAEKAGYDTTMLYHGTDHFGFTEFIKDMLDDKNSIFVAEDVKVASSYTRADAKTKAISEGIKADLWDMSEQDLVDLYNSISDTKYRFPTNEEIEADLENSRKELQKVSQDILNASKKADADERDVLVRIAEQINKAAKAESNTTVYFYIKEARDLKYDYEYDNDAEIEVLEEMNSDAFLDAIDRLSQRVGVESKYFVTEDGKNIKWANQLIYDLEHLKQGIYALYGKKGNLYQVDAAGANWDNIKAPEDMKKAGYEFGVATRDISEYARKNGYDGVRILNVRDSGGKTEGAHYPSNIRIYFDSSELKSADTVTYDDAGNVIPLSERFNKNENDIRFSLPVPVDSEGNKLSEGQQAFFADSKVRDEQGRLMRMYHGTPNGTFTVFKGGSYFTNMAWYADRYQNQGASSLGYKKTADNPRTYEAYLNITKPFDTRDPEIKKIWDDQYYHKWDTGEIADSGLPDWTSAEGLLEFIEENELDFDGLIIDEGRIPGDDGEVISRGLAWVPINGREQVKSVDNLNPTEDPDIRFSIDVDAFMDAFDEIDNQVELNENELHELIENRMDLESDVSKKMISDVASNIKKLYNSGIDKKKLESGLRVVFRYLKNTARYTMEDVMTVMTDIARPVLENVKAASPEQEALYKDFVDFVKGYSIALDPGQMQEVKHNFNSYTDFKRMMAGKMKLDKNGTMLDDIWTEIADRSNGKLSYGTNPNDQPIELARYIQSLNPTYQTLQGQTLDSAATDLALEIFRQFYVQQSMTDAAEKVKDEITRRSRDMRDKYKALYNEALKQVESEKAINVKRLADEIEALTVEEQDAIRNGDAVTQALIENVKRDYQERYDRLQAQSNDKIAQARAQYQNSWINKNLRRERSELKQRVLKEVKALQNILAHPAEGATKHVPVKLIKPTIEMLEAINLDNGGANKAIAERLKKMAEVYESFKNDDTYGFDYDERLASDIEELKELFLNRSYADLEITELYRVIEIVQALKTQIKNANNLILQGRLQDAKEAAENSIRDVKRSRRYDNAATNALNRYGNIHLNAYREFRKLSGYKQDSDFMKLYEDLDEGSHREMQIQKDLGAIFKDVLEGQKNQKEVKKFISTKPEDLVELGTNRAGKPIKITRAMRMSLILHSMNAGNMRHILGSGITVPNMYYFEKGKLEEAYAKGTNYRFVDYAELLNAIQNNNEAKIKELTTKAEERIEKMKEDLSPWEKDFLAAAEKMFHDETGKLINETSMKLKGYAIARVKNYFPIRTDSHFTAQEWAGLVRDGSLEGMGMLKERVTSTKPILLEDVTNVIQRQIGSVSKYAGYAVPLRNFEMIMKQTSRDQETGELHNLAETIDTVWGANDTKWLKNLLQDIQGGRKENRNFMMNLRGQFAGATLTLNPSVAIKQAASYPTAAAVVGYKTLARAAADIRKGFITAQGIEELERINPLLWYRNQGNATQELADAKAVGFGKNLPLWAQRAINWTQWFDTGTVRTLEYASMYYVDENFKNLEKGSKKYWEKVSEVFTNVVEQTQPNYSTLHKADIIRNPNSIVKMLVMFKTQPMQNFGIIYDAMGELNAAKISGNKAWVKEASSKAALAISSQVVSASVFSAMTILSQLLLHRWWKYRDDDGNWSWEKFWVAFGTGALSCMTGALIGGSELYEALKHWLTGSTYYGIEVSVVEMVNDLVSNIGALTKNAKALWDAETSEDKEKATQKLLKASAKLGATFGELKGTPVNNIKNMLSSIYYYATDIVRSIDEGELSISNESDPTSWEIKSQYERIYEALQTGDTDKYNKLVEELKQKSLKEKSEELKEGTVTEDDIATKVEESVTSKITNLMKADYLEGNITEEEMQDFLVNERGKTEEQAYFQMRRWSTGETSDYGTTKKLISAAAADPTPENRKAVIDEIETLLAHGKEKGEIGRTITTNYKDEYISLYKEGKAADLNSILRTALKAAGYTDEEAKKKLNDWVK